ncbi:MSHA biogenesis protein MshI [Pseudomonas alcaligenes]|uniref:MSHA biogenesis protein MshI n=1 Tax=Aquipseudomonas alcaligenes TaxID=43263 RepID=A0ABR7S645_AQUAC|nr:PilN domain-containing protein [Pseudomonas alcaligenes]MBC9252529.1 MSHA biogenesis protein MshI [Pseudomonas alcaligenes]
MQNLNLYQVERKSRGAPRQTEMIAGLLVLVLVCLLHAAWQAWQLHSGEQRLAQKEQDAQEQETRLAAAKASFVDPVLDPSLPKEAAAREAENRELQRLLTYLNVLDGQQAAGFVAPLRALSAQHPQSGLWLTAIGLSEGGSQMRLQGRSQGQEDLPRYLERLGQSPQFKGREFARFEVQRQDDQLLHFDLSSRLDDKEKAGE